MSARADDAAPQGETPRKQNTKRTVPGLMAGIGASGAVLAGGIVSFVVLVGAVSFDAWPQSAPAPTAESSELFSAPAQAVKKPAKNEVASTRPDRRDPAPAPATTSEPDSDPAPSSGGSGGGGSQGGGGDQPSRSNPKPSTGTSQSGGTGSTGSTGVADGGGTSTPPAGDDGGSSRPDQSGPRGGSGGRGG